MRLIFFKNFPFIIPFSFYEKYFRSANLNNDDKKWLQTCEKQSKTVNEQARCVIKAFGSGKMNKKNNEGQNCK